MYLSVSLPLSPSLAITDLGTHRDVWLCGGIISLQGHFPPAGRARRMWTSGTSTRPSHVILPRPRLRPRSHHRNQATASPPHCLGPGRTIRIPLLKTGQTNCLLRESRGTNQTNDRSPRALVSPAYFFFFFPPLVRPLPRSQRAEASQSPFPSQHLCYLDLHMLLAFARHRSARLIRGSHVARLTFPQWAPGLTEATAGMAEWWRERTGGRRNEFIWSYHLLPPASELPAYHPCCPVPCII